MGLTAKHGTKGEKMAKTVLIVDDDPTQRRLLRAVVEKHGFSTLQAGDGDAALDMTLGPDGGNIDLMLLDLIMPGRDGMDTLAELKKSRPDLPVIVLTGKGSIDAVVTAMQSGARDFIVKPASPERIIIRSGLAGLTMKSRAPDCIAVTTASIDPFPVKTITGRSGRDFFNSANVSMPSRPGIIRSSSIKSIFPPSGPRVMSRAASPSPA